MPLALAIALGSVLRAPGGGALYKWTDANGRVVYSDQPPPGDMKVDRIAGPPPPANPNAVKEMANKEAEIRSSRPKRPRTSKKACKARRCGKTSRCVQGRPRRNYRLAADQILLYKVNEKGETIFMDEAERRRRRETLETYIKVQLSAI